MRRSPLSTSLGLACLALLAPALCVAGCSEDVTPAATALSGGCSVNTDCNAPLVCAFARCHVACTQSRDCAAGERCVASDRPYHVCLLPEESRCAYNSDCKGLNQVCGVDGQCRDRCSGARDCLLGQNCVTGTCADPTELDAGSLPATSDASAEASGQPCSYSSECPEPFVCKVGLCTYECQGDVDCAPGQACTDHHCLVPLCGGEDGGPGAGAACTYSSQCAEPLVCRYGRCDCECLGDTDCKVGFVCQSHACVAAPPAP